MKVKPPQIIYKSGNAIFYRGPVKNFIENSSDFSVNIYNLALLKSSISTNIFEKFKYFHKKDKNLIRFNLTV